MVSASTLKRLVPNGLVEPNEESAVFALKEGTLNQLSVCSQSIKSLLRRHGFDSGSSQCPVALTAGVKQRLKATEVLEGSDQPVAFGWVDGDVNALVGNTPLIKPSQGFATGGTFGVAPDLQASHRESASEEVLDGTEQAVGTLTHPIAGPGTDGDVTVDAGAAAQAVVRWTVGQIDLLDIRAGREVLGTLDNLHHTGAALADTAAVVEVVQTLVRVDAGVEGGLSKIGPFNATDLLAFLLETDGGHGSFTCWARTNLQASRHQPAALQRNVPGTSPRKGPRADQT
jgi:hypothetical protein